jgi:fused signal recognition particle receptor
LLSALQNTTVRSEAELKNTLATFLKSKLAPHHPAGKLDPLATKQGAGPRVIMIVGVNGAGKTTTVGKLAAKLRAQGSKVLVGACDTFRAAAVDQLQVWCDRAGADMVRAKDGADPSGVAFETVARAQREGHDFCLVDTAGRLHTASGLMDELAKTKRVMAKVDPSFPQEVWLVIDAITGQNALKQAQEFHKSLGLTGLVFTKCDGSAKAGSAVAIVQQLQVPITYIGVGESVDDLQPFSVDEYVSALVGLPQS